MRRFYEDKLSEMKARVQELEAQRDVIMSDLKSTSSSPDVDTAKSHDVLQTRLKETEKQLADMKAKQRDLERISEIKAKMGAEVRERVCAVSGERVYAGRVM